MWNHKDFLIFFAAGNSGPGTASVGSPSTAKSAVSVGATLRGTTANSMASFSSCGPTDDGRIKPEVTVPGSGIVSANADNNIALQQLQHASGCRGTSMASPGAAGLAALVRQYYTRRLLPDRAPRAPPDGFTPSAALLRATLVNSAAADDRRRRRSPATARAGAACCSTTRSSSPATRAGSGSKDGRRLPHAAPPAKNTGLHGSRSAPASRFKVTLAWTDFPSTPAAKPHLNNDLDLEVTGPGGVVYRGNVFAGRPVDDRRRADRRNTLEQVLLTAPAPGTYTVTRATPSTCRTARSRSRSW